MTEQDGLYLDAINSDLSTYIDKDDVLDRYMIEINEGLDSK